MRVNNFEGIKGNRTLTLLDDSVAYEDIQFSFSTARQPASNAPTGAVFTTNLKKYIFDIDDYVGLEEQEVSHSRQAESVLYPHLHIFTNGVNVNDRYVKYIVYLDITNIDGVASEFEISKEFLIPANTADRTHLMCEFDAISGVGINHGAAISARFKRIAAAGTAPTGDPFCNQFGIHIIVDSVGSNAIMEK